MKVFVRDINTFESLAVLDASAWTLPVYSASDVSGSITVAGEYSYGGDWAIIDGMVYYLEQSAPSGGATTLTVKKPFYAFNRDLIYSGTGTEELGAFIANEIETEFVNQSDEEYAAPYISVVSDTDINVDLGFGENEVFSFADIFALAVEEGIEFTFTPDFDSLEITINEIAPQTHNIFFGDGKNFLDSATLTSEIVAKCTVRRITVKDSLITVVSSTDFYWHSDGSVTETPPVPRIKGSWAVVSITDADIELVDGAKEAMADNASAYKITFYSDLDLGLRDVCTFRINDKVVVGTITLKRVSSSARTYYECGDLPTTMTEKFSKATTPKVASKSVTYESKQTSYVSSSGGTIEGLDVDGTLTANGSIVIDQNSYGTSLPASGTEGQIFFVVS